MPRYLRSVVLRIPAVQLRSVAARYCCPWVFNDSGRLAPTSPAGERAPADLTTAQRDPLTTRLEAVLFLAREPLHPRRLARLANLADGTQARTLVARLNSIYDAEQRAFRAEEVGGGFQLRTRHQFAPWLRRLQHVPAGLRLSQPAMETLAVIAYRQPVLRAEIDAIRGVQCGEVIRQLMERDLVRIAGRSAELGRPYLYGTTRKFLQVFGLRDLSDLPRADLLRDSGPKIEDVSTDSSRNHSVGDFAVTVSSVESELELQHHSRAIEERINLVRAQDNEDWVDDDDAAADDDEEWDDDDADDDDEEDDADADADDDDDDDVVVDDEEDEDWEEDDLDEDEADIDDEDWDDDEEDWEEVDDEDDEEWEDDDFDDDEEDEDDEEWEDEEEDDED